MEDSDVLQNFLGGLEFVAHFVLLTIVITSLSYQGLESGLLL